jgi:pyruvate dehydrogenase E1 component alpha subunit
MVHRWTGHSMSDPDAYRTDEERKAGEKKDPVARFRGELMEESFLTAEEYEAIEAQVRKEIQEAVDYAEHECTPVSDVSDILRGVYASE